MPTRIATTTGCGGTWDAVHALAASDGSGSHAMARRLLSASMRDIADAVHYICILHGRQPGVIDHAATRAPDPAVAAWLAQAADAFAGERAAMSRMVAAVGPLPSTPGQAESESAVNGQRHALDMLAQSDRTGCAIGAAVALVLDWTAIRAVIDAAAHRLGVTLQPGRLPDDSETADMVATLVTQPSIERALMFGTQQVLAQHRGLWDLLEARAEARADVR